jgi:hypothetical protein
MAIRPSIALLSIHVMAPGTCDRLRLLIESLERDRDALDLPRPWSSTVIAIATCLSANA